MSILHTFRRMARIIGLTLLVTMTSWSARLDLALAAAQDAHERAQRLQEVAEIMGVDPLMLKDPARYHELRRLEGQQKVREFIAQEPHRPEWFQAQEAVNLLIRLHFARSLHTTVYETCWQADETLADLSVGQRKDYRVDQLVAFRHALAVLHGQTGLLIEADTARLAGDASWQPWLTGRLDKGDWSASQPPEILPGSDTVPAASREEQRAFARNAEAFQNALQELVDDLDTIITPQKPTLLASLSLVARDNEQAKATRLHGKFGRFLDAYADFMHDLFTPPAAEAFSIGDCRINMGYPWSPPERYFAGGATWEEASSRWFAELAVERCGEDVLLDSIFGPSSTSLRGFLGSEHWTIGPRAFGAISGAGSVLAEDLIVSSPPMPGTEQTSPVNFVGNGNFIRRETDLGVSHIGPPIFLSRTYNAQSNDIGPLGIGWHHNYQQRLELSSDGNIVYVDEDATRYSVPFENGAYVTPPGRFFTLEETSPGLFTMTMKGQMVYTFEAIGDTARLIEQRDNNGNTVTLNYSGDLLASVTDSSGRTALAFTYDADGFLQQVNEYWGRTFDYVVVESELIEAYDVIGARTAYIYDRRGKMVGIEDAEGEMEVRVYDAYSRLLSHVDKIGVPALFSYTRSHDSVIYTDRRGFDEMLVLDDRGRAVASIDAQGNRLEADWNDDNLVTNFRDGQGNSYTYEYDDRGNQTRSISPFGQVVREFHPVWDAPEHHLQLFVVFEGGSPLFGSARQERRETTLEYDASGNVTKLHSSTDLNMTYVYGPKGVPTSMVNFEGITTLYDVNLTTGFTESATTLDPDDGPLTTTYTYDSNGSLVEIEDPQGLVTRYVVNLRGEVLETLESEPVALPVKEVSPSLGASLRRSPGSLPLGRSLGSLLRTLVVSEEAAAQDAPPTFISRSRRSYDSLGRVTSSTDQYGNVSTVEYDPLSRVTRSVSRTGEVTTMTYDEESNVLSMTNSDGTMSYTYDEIGQRLTTTYTLGNTTAIQRCAGIAAAGCTSCGGAPPCGVVDELGNLTKYTVDQFGRQTAVQDPLGNTVLMEHDERGNRVLMIDAEGNRTEHEYDIFDNLVRVSLFDGPRELITRYEYDSFNRRTAFIDAKGNRTEYEYNQEGQMVAESRRADANFTQVTRMSYNQMGLVNSVTLPDGNIIYHEYDTRGRLAAKRLNAVDAPAREFYEYDAFDRLTFGGNDQATFRYAYDGLGRVASSTQRMANLDRNFTLTRTYDVQSRLIAMTDHDGLATQYRYDAMNRLIAMGTPAGEHRFLFDARGARVGMQFPNGHETVNVVDEDARLLSVATTTKLGDPVATYAYELDSMGMRTAVDEVLAYPGSDTATRRHTYEYDDLYRLTRVDYDASFNRPAETYTYDDAHNRATLTREGVGTINYQYDELDRLLSTTGLENRSYEYTPNGQLAIENNNGNTTTYDWDVFGRLRERSLNGITQGTYEYAANGYRTFMDEGEATHFVLNGPNVLADIVGGATERRYVHGMNMDDLYAVTNSEGVSQYYHRDGSGSVVAVSNDLGGQVSAQSYSVWGERVDTLTTGLDGTVGSRFGYTSREHGVGGDTYHRARYNRPGLGRWLSQDEWRGDSNAPTTKNRYTYSGNDSINLLDANGRLSNFSTIAVTSIIGVIINIGHSKAKQGGSSCPVLEFRACAKDGAKEARAAVKEKGLGGGVGYNNFRTGFGNAMFWSGVLASVVALVLLLLPLAPSLGITLSQVGTIATVLGVGSAGSMGGGIALINFGTAGQTHLAEADRLAGDALSIFQGCREKLFNSGGAYCTVADLDTPDDAAYIELGELYPSFWQHLYQPDFSLLLSQQRGQ